MGVRLIGTGSALPSRRVTNDDLARIVDTSDEWICSRTGIRERRYLGEGESQLSLACAAAERALQAAGIEPGEIGVCLVATFTADTATPSTACMLQHELGLSEDTFCLDLNAACAGFVYGLHVAERLLAGGGRPYALVVGAEALSRVIDFADRSTCVLFGDGAGAVVLRRDADAGSLCAVWGTRGDNRALMMPGAHAVEAGLHMDGRAVFRFATEVLPKCVFGVLEQSDLVLGQVDRFVFHQANQRIVDTVVKKLGLDPRRCEGNIARTGNTSAASVPILLDELVRSKSIQTAERVLVAGFGAGLTWAACLIEIA